MQGKAARSAPTCEVGAGVHTARLQRRTRKQIHEQPSADRARLLGRSVWRIGGQVLHGHSNRIWHAPSHTDPHRLYPVSNPPFVVANHRRSLWLGDCLEPFTNGEPTRSSRDRLLVALHQGRACCRVAREVDAPLRAHALKLVQLHDLSLVREREVVAKQGNRGRVDRRIIEQQGHLRAKRNNDDCASLREAALPTFANPRICADHWRIARDELNARRVDNHRKSEVDYERYRKRGPLKRAGELRCWRPIREVVGALHADAGLSYFFGASRCSPKLTQHELQEFPVAIRAIGWHMEVPQDAIYRICERLFSPRQRGLNDSVPPIQVVLVGLSPDWCALDERTVAQAYQ